MWFEDENARSDKGGECIYAILDSDTAADYPFNSICDRVNGKGFCQRVLPWALLKLNYDRVMQ